MCRFTVILFVKIFRRLDAIFFLEMLEHIERKLFLNGKPIDSTVSLSNEDFSFAGEGIAMSILQGGPAPSFFDPNVFDYISNQPLSPESIKTYKEAALKVLYCYLSKLKREERPEF